MVDPITMAIGFGVYSAYRSHKSKQRERERGRELQRACEIEREQNAMRERERLENERAERARQEAIARAKKIKEAQEEANRVREKQADEERRLKEGAQTFTLPSLREVENMKRAQKYDSNNIHIAIAGVSGGGKSSLVNAIRGLAFNYHGPLAAETGVTETTLDICRYPMSDVRPGSRIVLYDVPGAGTLTIPDQDYFKSQGLYIFDAIILLSDVRFTKIDIVILRICKELNIPCFLVRSKSDLHIEHTLEDMSDCPSDDDDDDDENGDLFRAKHRPAARDNYAQRTRANIASNLAQAGINHQNVYLVSRSVVWSVVNGQPIKKSEVYLDEHAFVKEVTNFVPSRLL